MAADAPALVKVYRLNSEGLWDDKGTGHISCEFLVQSDAVGLIVVSEDDTRPLLIHRISRDEGYHRQSEDTIITWSDPEIGTDIALSFAEVSGCNYIWDHIQRVQGAARPSEPPHPMRRGEVAVDDFDSGLSDFPEVGPAQPVDLPPPELSALPELAKALQQIPFMQREMAAQQLIQAGYVRKVLELFVQLEDLGDTEALGQVYSVVKGMVLLGEAQLLEVLLCSENVMAAVGALEYEPGVSEPAKHRQFLQQHVVFKEVIPIRDPGIRQRIHQAYQMAYVKDVVLPRVLDDAAFAALSSLILFYNHDILMALLSDEAFLPELFLRLRTVPPSQQEWHDLVRLLQELCASGKQLQPGNRQQLMAKLVGLGLFDMMGRVLAHTCEELQYKALDVLLSTVQHDASLLRAFLLAPEGQALFGTLVRLLATSRQAGLQEQVLELVRVLLDPESLDMQPEKDTFLELFYQAHMPTIGAVLSGQLPQSTGSAQNESGTGQWAPAAAHVPARTLGVVMELLCFCVQHHAYRIKYYVLRNNVVEKALELLQRRERWLAVAAVRFLRTAVGLKDEFYNRYIVRNSLLTPVFDAFVANGERYNLLNSAVLELMEFIRRENVKGLVAHVVESFMSLGPRVEDVETFKQLKIKHEQNMEREESGATGDAAGGAELRGGLGGGVASGGAVREERAMDGNEEDYFSTDGGDDGDQPTNIAASDSLPSTLDGRPLLKLVDYTDDDDDDDNDVRFMAGARRAVEHRPLSINVLKRTRREGEDSGQGGAGGNHRSFG